MPRHSLYNRFSNNVRAILEQRDMSQTELADLLGLTRGQVTHILNGRQEPSLTTLSHWAQKLRVEPAELLKPVTHVYRNLDRERHLIRETHLA